MGVFPNHGPRSAAAWARGRRGRFLTVLSEAIAALEHDRVLGEAMGDPLFEAFLAVRRAEVERFRDKSDNEVAAATRWIR